MTMRCWKKSVSVLMLGALSGLSTLAYASEPPPPSPHDSLPRAYHPKPYSGELRPSKPATQAPAASAPTAPPSVAISAPPPPPEPAPVVNTAAYEQTRTKLETIVDVYIVNRTLEQALQDIARLAGLRVRLNDRVDASLSTRRFTGRARDLLDEITRDYNLTWFAERDLIDVSRADTATVKTLKTEKISDKIVRDALLRYGLINVEGAVEVDTPNSVTRLFGSPRLVSRVESIVVGLKPPVDPPAIAVVVPPQPPAEPPIEIIRYGQSSLQGGNNSGGSNLGGLGGMNNSQNAPVQVPIPMPTPSSIPLMAPSPMIPMF
jgi:hypothetical protein